MSFKASDIAEKIGGILDGDGDVEVRGLAGLEDAEMGDLSFLANPKYASAVAETRASVVIVNDDWSGECKSVVIKVKSADAGFAAAAALLAPKPVAHEPGMHPSSVVSDDAVLGEGVSVGPLCVIDKGARIGARTVICAGTVIGQDTVIGEDCFLHPNVTVRDRMIVGDRTIIHSGAVVGSDGFGYTNNEGKWEKIPQIGVVKIGDDVEIGANVTIDRARFGRTIIGNGVKLDNMVQVAHNVRIGENTAMAAQSGISGSTRVGMNVQVGGQAGIVGHINVGDNAIIGGGGGVIKDVKPGDFVWGTPAMPIKKFLRLHTHVGKLPQLKEKTKELEKRISELENRT